MRLSPLSLSHTHTVSMTSVVPRWGDARIATTLHLNSNTMWTCALGGAWSMGGPFSPSMPGTHHAASQQTQPRRNTLDALRGRGGRDVMPCRPPAGRPLSRRCPWPGPSRCPGERRPPHRGWSATRRHGCTRCTTLCDSEGGDRLRHSRTEAEGHEHKPEKRLVNGVCEGGRPGW